MDESKKLLTKLVHWITVQILLMLLVAGLVELINLKVISPHLMATPVMLILMVLFSFGGRFLVIYIVAKLNWTLWHGADKAVQKLGRIGFAISLVTIGNCLTTDLWWFSGIGLILLLIELRLTWVKLQALNHAHDNDVEVY